MEPESPSPYPQVPATCPYSEPTPSSPHDPLQLPLHFLRYILMLSPIYLFLPGGAYHLRFYTWPFYVFILFNYREAAPPILTAFILFSWCYWLHYLLQNVWLRVCHSIICSVNEMRGFYVLERNSFGK